MKWIFIVNKAAGNGKSKKVVNNIIKYCNNKEIDYLVHYTRCSGEATTIALKYKKEKNIIFAVGGDGTVNEVLNGIVNTKNILSVIPAGSGNDFYKTLKMYPDGMVKCDIGKINDIYFLNTVCFGIDADVANNIDYMRMRGIPANKLYIASILNTLFKFKFKKLSFKINDVDMSGEFTTLVVCNGRFYGNGFKVSPKSKIDDGLLDTYYVDKLSKGKLINLLFKLKSGLHESSPFVHKKLTKEVIVKTDKNLVANIDGEKYLSNEFKIKIVRKPIHIYNNKLLVKELLNNGR